MHQFLLHNGEIRSTADTLLSPGQVGYLNGWGVFSTFRVARGVLFAFERHYRRLQRDAKLLHVPLPWTTDELLRYLHKLVEANGVQDGVLRVAIVRNRGGVFEGPLKGRDADLVAFTSELRQWGNDVKLTYEPNARFGLSEFAGMKSMSWSQNLTLYERAQEAGFDEAVLLNQAGEVSECTSANIFAIQGEHVFTPPLSTSGCLPGITRATLLEDIQVEGIWIQEREITPSELEASDCVFITSSTRDLLPVHSIDNSPLPQETEVLHILQSRFSSYLQSYIAQAVSDKILVNT